MATRKDWNELTFAAVAAALSCAAVGCAEGAADAVAVDAGSAVADAAQDAGTAGFLVHGGWLVRGEAPTPERCRADRIDTVTLELSDDADGATVQMLSAACARGTVRGQERIPWGRRYRAAWIARDESGAEIERVLVALPVEVGWPTTEREIHGISFAVPPLQPGDWAINAQYEAYITSGPPPDGSTVCEHEGVARIRLTLHPLGVPGTDLRLEVDCDADRGSLRSEQVLTWGVTYGVLWEALGPGGQVVQQHDAAPVRVVSPVRTMRGLTTAFVWSS